MDIQEIKELKADIERERLEDLKAVERVLKLLERKNGLNKQVSPLKPKKQSSSKSMFDYALEAIKTFSGTEFKAVDVMDMLNKINPSIKFSNKTIRQILWKHSRGENILFEIIVQGAGKRESVYKYVR